MRTLVQKDNVFTIDEVKYHQYLYAAYRQDSAVLVIMNSMVGYGYKVIEFRCGDAETQFGPSPRHAHAFDGADLKEMLGKFSRLGYEVLEFESFGDFAEWLYGIA